MRKVLEDLYFGNIVPYEKRIAAGSELRHLVKRQHHGKGIFYPGLPAGRQIDDRVHG